MQSFTKRCALALATLATAVTALDGIVAPSEVAAGEEFEVTFQSSNDDSYRVYLAASLAGSNGPTCYLVNSTELDDSINVTIPASVGPTANYYSIAIADITTGQAATFSNRFNLTGATGEYSDYEDVRPTAAPQSRKPQMLTCPSTSAAPLSGPPTTCHALPTTALANALKTDTPRTLPRMTPTTP